MDSDENVCLCLHAWAEAVVVKADVAGEGDD